METIDLPGFGDQTPEPADGGRERGVGVRAAGRGAQDGGKFFGGESGVADA